MQPPINAISLSDLNYVRREVALLEGKLARNLAVAAARPELKLESRDPGAFVGVLFLGRLFNFKKPVLKEIVKLQRKAGLPWVTIGSVDGTQAGQSSWQEWLRYAVDTMNMIPVYAEDDFGWVTTCERPLRPNSAMADLIVEAAAAVAEPRRPKVLLVDVRDALEARTGQEIDLERLKEAALRAHRAGELELVRVDLPKRPQAERDSEIRYLHARFHAVKVPEEMLR